MESKNAKLSNIEAHNKCYYLLPDFISKCLSLGIKVNYVIEINNKFEIISVKDDYLKVLQKMRKESNVQTSHDYKERIENIKKCMLSRKAPREQFTELKKIETVYFDISENKETRKEK